MKNTIAIVTIHPDKSVSVEQIELPINGRRRTDSTVRIRPTDDCRITLYPGIPPLGSDAFTAWLLAWHLQHNGSGHA